MGAPQAAGPVWIDPPKVPQFFGTQNGGGWLIGIGSALYLFQTQHGSLGIVNPSAVYKSTDGGNTWIELDGADRPVAEGAAVYDPIGNRFICALTVAVFPVTSPIFLQDFNLGTETWGAAYATSGGPGTVGVFQVFLRPDGTIAVFFAGDTPPPIGETTLRGAIWDGATWSSSIDVGTAALAFGGTFASSVCACMEPISGVIHLAFASKNAAGSPSTADYFYQQFKADNSLGASNHFTAASLGLSLIFANIVLFGSSLVISFAANSRADNSVIVGTPLSAPVWTQTTPAALSGLGSIGTSGMIVSDGTTLYWMVNFGFPAAYKLATSPDGSTWTVVPDNTSPPFFYDFGSSPLAPNLNVGAGTIESPLFALVTPGVTTVYGFTTARNTTSAFTSYFMNSEAFGSGPPPPPKKTTKTPTFSAAAAPFITARPAPKDAGKSAGDALAQLLLARKAWPFPWVHPPCGATRVTAQHSILVPTAGVLTEALLYTVEQGFQFALAELVVENLFDGRPAQDDPGSFLWSMTVNQPIGITTFQGSPVQGFNQVDVSLGTLQIPWPLECPEIFQPNDAIRIAVNNVTLTPGAQNFIHAIFLGWRWPIG
jgi:hypothetical protein